MKKNIYLDYAGTTPMDPRVERMISNYSKNIWGNASSAYETGRKAKQLIEGARKTVAEVLGAKSDEIIFTGSGTESDNLAIFGIARAYKKFGRHIITSKIEHPAVLRVCEYLKKEEGFDVTYVGTNSEGIIDPMDVARALRPSTVLVSIMYANNEIGTIQPIAEIGKILKQFRQQKLEIGNWKLEIHERVPFFHVDACQAAGALNLNVHNLGVDMFTLNGSKIYGPKGIGCLYVRSGIEISPIIIGGSQERGLRAGTENPATIAGFAEALVIADKTKINENIRLVGLRDYFICNILKQISGSRLNGDSVKRLPNNINISFEGIDGEMLILALDEKGIQVSTGSACTSTSIGPSHVLVSLYEKSGLAKKMARSLSGGNIRITLGRQTTKKDMEYVLKRLPSIVRKLRR